MSVLFIITSSDIGTWLSEVTHPYWHLTERGVDVDFASPLGGKVGWTPRSDPYTRNRRGRRPGKQRLPVGPGPTRQAGQHEAAERRQS